MVLLLVWITLFLFMPDTKASDLVPITVPNGEFWYHRETADATGYRLVNDQRLWYYVDGNPKYIFETGEKASAFDISSVSFAYRPTKVGQSQYQILLMYSNPTLSSATVEYGTTPVWFQQFEVKILRDEIGGIRDEINVAAYEPGNDPILVENLDVGVTKFPKIFADNYFGGQWLIWRDSTWFHAAAVLPFERIVNAIDFNGGYHE